MRKIIFFFIFSLTLSLNTLQSSQATEQNEIEFCSKNIEKRIEKKIENYQIAISYANNRMCQKLDILKQGKIVYHEEGIDNHYDFKKKWFNDGTQLAISKWTGGTHCCMSLLIFQLGNNFKKIADIYGGNFDPEITDLNHDGIQEIKITDDFLAYRFSSFGTSAIGTVILKYSNGAYTLSEEMMKHTPQNTGIIKNKVNSWGKEFLNHGPDWPPKSFIQTLTNLVYSGNVDQSFNFVNQEWPSNIPGKAEFLTSYKEALSESKYYSKVAEHFRTQ